MRRGYPAIRSCVLTTAVLLTAVAVSSGHDHKGAGPDAASVGRVNFVNSCAETVQPALQSAISHLHSFDWAAPSFIEIARQDRNCAIAWWGAAMSVRGNPLGGSLDGDAFKTGRGYIDNALKLKSTVRERGFIDALDIYYRNYASGGHAARTRAYEAAMQKVLAGNPGDAEAIAFTALAILEAVDLNDKTYARQLKAGALLEPLLARDPDHPGAPHYLIHAYDYAPLAARALPAARRYAAMLPASAHARHMPAHIFTILGLWQESVAANEHSAAIVDAAAPNPDIIDSHGFDFIAYARLQLAQDARVSADLAMLRAKNESPVLAEARYALERGDWQLAGRLAVPKEGALDQATARFTRALGAARLGDAARARAEWQALGELRKVVAKSDGEYWAALVDIYAGAAQAWCEQAEGRGDRAIAIMQEAAARDDAREKHIYLENKLLPMREVLAELLLATGRAADAAREFERSLEASPNRFRSFAGAAHAAASAGDAVKAREWSKQLLTLAADADTQRPEIAQAKAYLAN